VWLVDSTPVECAHSRPTVQRSDLAGAAGYGYCASHSRYFWGLRLHLICTPTGLPIIWALAHLKLDERQVLIRVFDHNRQVVTGRPGQRLLAPIRQLIESVNDTPQGLTRPGTARRADPGRGQGPDRPGTARPDRRDLAQPRHRPAGYKIADRLRPLIDLGISRL